MPQGLTKPFNLKKIIRQPPPLLCHVMGCFHGIKLSLGKWTLLILSNCLLGISLIPVYVTDLTALINQCNKRNHSGQFNAFIYFSSICWIKRSFCVTEVFKSYNFSSALFMSSFLLCCKFKPMLCLAVELGHSCLDTYQEVL